jgi:hypothetical protein
MKLGGLDLINEVLQYNLGGYKQKNLDRINPIEI